MKKQSRRLLTFFISVCMLLTFGIGSFTTVSGEADTIYFSKDYTTLATDDATWADDAESMNGLKLQAVDGTMMVPMNHGAEGSIVYKISPSAGKVFKTLNLAFKGRVSDSEDNAERSYLKVALSADNVNFAQAGSIGGTSVFDTNGDHVIDLSTAAANQGTLYVKLQLAGGINDWCALKTLKLSGTEGEKVYLSKDFTALAVDNATWADDAESMNGLKLQAVDGTMMVPLNHGAEGFIIYKISPNAGKVFKTLNLAFKGRVSDSEDNAERSYLKVALSTDNVNFTQAGSIGGTSVFDTNGNHQIDLSAAALNQGPLYVKIQMAGGINDWCAIKTLAITGSEDDMVFINKDFSALAVDDATWANDAVSMDGLKLQAVDGTMMVPLNHGATGNIVYMVNPGTGYILQTLVLNFKGRVSDSEDNAERSYLKVSVSKDNVTYTDAGSIGGTSVWDTNGNHQIDLSTAALNQGPLYVKLQLAGGINDWCAIKTLKLSGQIIAGTPADDGDDDEETNYGGSSISVPYSMDFSGMNTKEETWKTDIFESTLMEVYKDPGDSVGMLCPDMNATSDGIGSVVYKLTAAEGQKLGPVCLITVGRVFTYQERDGRYLKVLVSTDDGVSYTEVNIVEDQTESGSKSMRNTFSMTSLLSESTSALVKIEINSAFWDWVGLKSLSFEVPHIVTAPYEKDFTTMSHNSIVWKDDVFSYNLMKAYRGDDGLTALTTDMNVTDKGRGYFEYIVAAPEGETFSELSLDFVGRAYDQNEDANRGFTISTSADDGKTFTEVQKNGATADATRSVDFSVDLSAQASGKSYIHVRIEINSAYWDWASVESLAFNTTPVEPSESETSSEETSDVEETSDDDTAPETGDTTPYALYAIIVAGIIVGAVACTKKEQKT